MTHLLRVVANNTAILNGTKSKNYFSLFLEKFTGLAQKL